MSINAIKARVKSLQESLGCQLQVTVYNSKLNSSDDLLSAAKDCRMSIITEEGAKEWHPGRESASIYAVNIVAEEFGEIPYALMAESIYVEGEKGAGKQAFSEHTLAMASLTTAVTQCLDYDQLYKFLQTAKERGKITEEQFLLSKKHFLSADEEELCSLV
tara:strand:+ start:17111 stop:17593 length:483 start_codon:yes stop_codon:yes gene_type:complete